MQVCLLMIQSSMQASMKLSRTPRPFYGRKLLQFYASGATILHERVCAFPKNCHTEKPISQSSIHYCQSRWGSLSNDVGINEKEREGSLLSTKGSQEESEVLK